jgi:hypothetical protein
MVLAGDRVRSERRQQSSVTCPPAAGIKSLMAGLFERDRRSIFDGMHPADERLSSWDDVFANTKTPRI